MGRVQDTGGGVMDEILLTTEELAPIMAYAVGKWNSWTPDEKRAKPWAEYSREVACHAQVRKVVEYMEREGTMVYERQVGFVLPFPSWKALKAAVEGE